MIILGLTGSIGMGKSTTAGMFRTEGVAVHDSDSTVHRLYEGAAVPLVEAAFPGTVRDGKVDRQALSRHVVGNREAMRRLELIIHPLVSADRDRFLAENRHAGSPLVVLDIPLLFETGSERMCDVVAVVTAPAEIQRQRVMSRPAMTEEKFAALVASQMPDGEKRKRADFIIDTSRGLEAAHEQVCEIIGKLKGGDG